MTASHPTDSIESYIATFSTDVQTILTKLRKTILAKVPNATEGISYGVPTVYLNGKYLVYFAAFKNHVSVYPATTQAVESVAGLSAYKVSKGTLRFPLTEPIPYDLIEQFVTARVQESEK